MQVSWQTNPGYNELFLLCGNKTNEIWIEMFIQIQCTELFELKVAEYMSDDSLDEGLIVSSLCKVERWNCSLLGSGLLGLGLLGGQLEAASSLLAGSSSGHNLLGNKHLLEGSGDGRTLQLLD